MVGFGTLTVEALRVYGGLLQIVTRIKLFYSSRFFTMVRSSILFEEDMAFSLFLTVLGFSKMDQQQHNHNTQEESWRAPTPSIPNHKAENLSHSPNTLKP